MLNRWISYSQQNIPGNQSFMLCFHDTLEDAKDTFQAFRRGVDSNECSTTVYYAGGDPEMVASAREFEGVGCPFDYPDRLIESGPRGGVKVSHC